MCRALYREGWAGEEGEVNVELESERYRKLVLEMGGRL